ncbi:hypothetical protein KJ969_04985 [Patescibacteria group bacterium]|nr:hypothetical protein [Patescibacteria group bacterium]MBU1922045.1 hypothetical protein [Patescibacteria group bacterium]
MATIKNNYSTYSLILANLATIVLAVAQGWNFSTLIWSYWLQSLIIGLFQFFKILDLKQFSAKGFKINNRPAKPTPGTKYFTAVFFVIHFGGFHFVYSVFLASSARQAEWGSILLVSAVFLANHLFSYFRNREEDRQKIKNIGTMLFFPYARIIPMHLTILFGFFLIGGPISLVFFLLLKTAADVVMHKIEHRQNQILFSQS